MSLTPSDGAAAALALNSMRVSLAAIDDHIETIREAATRTAAATADMRRRIDALEAGLKGKS